MRRLCVCFIASVFCFLSIAVEAQSARSKKVAPAPTVPRPAPDFLWSGVNGKVRRLRDLRGHPVVLIFAENPNQKEFVKQIKELNRRSKQLASRNTLFFVHLRKRPASSREPIFPLLYCRTPVRWRMRTASETLALR